MTTVALLLIHAMVTVARLVGPGGIRAVVTESCVIKHQLIVLNRARSRAPHLTTLDRLLLGMSTLLMTPRRLAQSIILVKPSTLMKLHGQLIKRKYRMLFSSTGKNRHKPGPKGPSQELIDAIVEMKRRNPRFGSPRIAQQIAKAFGIEIDKDIVRRVLAKHYRPQPEDSGPSWLTVLGHMKDSLWSVDLFRCESILLKSHWVMVVMDQHTRRIIGFGVQAGNVDGAALCRMFNRATAAIVGTGVPKYLSTDNDPLFLFHRWKANLRIRDIEGIKSVPNVPMSHPFVERMIGSIRREHLDHVFFWNAVDLERKLVSFKHHYNVRRTHASLGGDTPAEIAGRKRAMPLDINDFRWQRHCGGLFQLPAAA